MIKHRHKARRKSSWKKLIELYDSSGLSESDFCKEHDVSVHSLRRWQCQFSSGDPSAQGKLSGFIPLEVSNSVVEQEVGRIASPVCLSVGKNTELRFPSGLTTAELGYVLEIVCNAD